MLNISFDNIFLKLRNLESIDIRHIFYWRVVYFNNSMYINIVRQFPVTLKSLYMDIPGIPDFAQHLEIFTQLTDLGINAKDGCTMIITNDTFKPLQNIPIRSLTFYSNKLSRIEPLAFFWFSKLESLDLSKSTGILDINKLGEAWFGVNKNLKSLNLAHFKPTA